jgi:response regulator of citrate/malate metabolism
MKFINKRLDLNESEFYCLKKYIDFEKMEEAIKNFDYEYYKRLDIEEPLEATLLRKLNNPKEIEHSHKKSIASFRATEARTKAAKEKIQNAINILRMENKKITHYSIAQVSGVSFTTVKKYLNDDTLKSLNEIK